MTSQDHNLIDKIFSWGRKTAAVAFIVLILVANFWFVRRFTGDDVPQWTYSLFFLGLVGAASGFFMMVPGWLKPRKTQQEAEENVGNQKAER